MHTHTHTHACIHMHTHARTCTAHPLGTRATDSTEVRGDGCNFIPHVHHTIGGDVMTRCVCVCEVVELWGVVRAPPNDCLQGRGWGWGFWVVLCVEGDGRTDRHTHTDTHQVSNIDVERVWWWKTEGWWRPTWMPK